MWALRPGPWRLKFGLCQKIKKCDARSHGPRCSFLSLQSQKLCFAAVFAAFEISCRNESRNFIFILRTRARSCDVTAAVTRTFRNKYTKFPRFLPAALGFPFSLVSLTLRLGHFVVCCRSLFFLLEGFHFSPYVLNNFTYSSQYESLTRQKPQSLGLSKENRVSSAIFPPIPVGV